MAAKKKASAKSKAVSRKKVVKAKTKVATKAKSKMTSKKVKSATKKKTAVKSKSKAKVAKSKMKSKTKAKANSKTKSKAAGKSVKVASVVKLVKPKLGSKPYNKSELVLAIAADTGLEKKSVKAALESLEGVISAHLGKSLSFNLHGICKMVVKHKPATPARKGVNPFTGEEMMFKAKPASKVVRIRAFRKLKQLVS